MSHHGIHTIPSYMLPIERPLKLEQKRRLRKKNDSGDVDAEEIDDSGAVESKSSFAPVSATSGSASSALSSASSNVPSALQPTGRPSSRVFNQKVMGILLQAQEKKQSLA